MAGSEILHSSARPPLSRGPQAARYRRPALAKAGAEVILTGRDDRRDSPIEKMTRE